MVVEHLQHPSSQQAHRRVRRVGEGDDADSAPGQPAHVRAVAGQSSGVAGDVAEPLIVDDLQPEAVSAAVDALRDVVDPLARRLGAGQGAGPLHLLLLAS